MNIVAEISANHCQKFDKAVSLIQAAAWAGADSVKVQMFRPEDMAAPGGELTEYGCTLYELYEKACMPYDWVPVLKQIAEKLGLFFFTSVYHPDTVDIAEDMGIAAYKIASFEITYKDLLERVAETKKPVYISTGMADFQEIWAATRIIRRWHKDYHLLHCVSKYPAGASDMNLRTLYDLQRYCRPGHSGLSDHSVGITAPIIAATMGAETIEKHLKIDDEGLDSAFSLDPVQFRAMVNAVHDAKAAEGTIKYGGEKKYRRQDVNGKMLRV